MATVFGLLVAIHALPIWAVIVPGQVDHFEEGGLLNWRAGGVGNPNPPMNIASGGPGGADDNYLQLTSNGSGLAGGKLVVFNSNQWAGDYLGAAITSIDMQVKNFGTTDLMLRLILTDSLHAQALTTVSHVNVPAGGGWNTVSFSLDAANLTGGTYQTVISSVVELNLVHSPTVIAHRSLSPDIVAQLGVDNITAVFESSLTGDLNKDGFVGQDDLNIILANWGKNVVPGDLMMGDPSEDGFVGQDDLNDILAAWGQGTPSELESLSPVPEPDSSLLTMAAIAGFASLRRRFTVTRLIRSGFSLCSGR